MSHLDTTAVDLAAIERQDIKDLDGWKRFVAARDAFTLPALMTRPEYEALAPTDRIRYDVLRKIGINNMPKHETPMTAHIRAQVQQVLNGNTYRLDPGVRPGVFISADGAMGKSTLMREVAADFEREIEVMRAVMPAMNKFRDRWVPVAWITVPPKLSMGSLARAILDFYGESYQIRATDSQCTGKVERVIRDCGTKLLILDDITRYKDTDADRYASDWIRNLMETSVTVVAMGVDIRGSGILADGATGRDQRLRTQTSRRFAVLDIPPFRYDTASDIRDWVALLAGIEQDLLLLDKTDGMLTSELAEFLFEETDGVIGVLTDWVALATTQIVGRPPSRSGECLTKADFEAVPRKGAHGSQPRVEETRKPAAAKARKGRNTVYDQQSRRGVA